MAITPVQLIEKMQWRYATKVFDKTKKINSENWQALESTLVLTPSSYGLQPWKFIVITNEDVKKQLTAPSHNQAQVESCSHYVVFAHRSEMLEQDIVDYMTSIEKIRGTPLDKLEGYKNMVIKNIVQADAAKVHTWSANQCYIALGNFMTSAAVLGIDTCPMEGIKPAEYDKVLGLDKLGYKTVVACAAGYRSPEDKNQHIKKVRFSHERVVVRI